MGNHVSVLAESTALAALDSIPDAVLVTDLRGRITYLNPAAEVLTGWPRDAATGRPHGEIASIHAADDAMVPHAVLIRRDRRRIAVVDSTRDVYDTDGRLIGAVIVVRAVAAVLENSFAIAHLAHHDALTGLPNRLLLTDRLTEALALASRHGKPAAVLYLDIDRFKTVNDSLGHAAGDRLLQSIAARLTRKLRRSDTVSRHGGDEFVVVLTEIEQAVDAMLVAKGLLRVISEPHAIGAAVVRVTACAGAAVFPEHGGDPASLIERADAAMYAAKRSAPGTCRLADFSLVGAMRAD